MVTRLPRRAAVAAAALALFVAAAAAATAARSAPALTSHSSLHGLEHGLDYEVFRLRALHPMTGETRDLHPERHVSRHPTRMSESGEHPVHAASLSLAFSALGRDFRLHLLRNDHLFADTRIHVQGEAAALRNYTIEQCFYNGRFDEHHVRARSAVVHTCGADGIRAHLYNGDDVYRVEPAGDHLEPGTFEPHDHVVVRAQDAADAGTNSSSSSSGGGYECGTHEADVEPKAAATPAPGAGAARRLDKMRVPEDATRAPAEALAVRDSYQRSVELYFIGTRGLYVRWGMTSVEVSIERTIAYMTRAIHLTDNNFQRFNFDEFGLRLVVRDIELWNEGNPITVTTTDGTMSAFQDWTADLRQTDPHDVAVLLIGESTAGADGYANYVTSPCAETLPARNAVVKDITLSGAYSPGSAENVASTSLVMAHEIGHTCGLAHVDGNCNDKSYIMTGLAGGFPGNWSTCSVETFRSVLAKGDECFTDSLSTTEVTCGAGFFDNGFGGTEDSRCSLCDTNCRTCTDLSNCCMSCNAGLSLDPDHICVETCPTGYYAYYDDTTVPVELSETTSVCTRCTSTTVTCATGQALSCNPATGGSPYCVPEEDIGDAAPTGGDGETTGDDGTDTGGDGTDTGDDGTDSGDGTDAGDGTGTTGEASTSGSSGSSIGIMAGAAVGGVILAAILAGAVVMRRRHKRDASRTSQPRVMAVGSSSALPVTGAQRAYNRQSSATAIGSTFDPTSRAAVSTCPAPSGVPLGAGPQYGSGSGVGGGRVAGMLRQMEGSTGSTATPAMSPPLPPRTAAEPPLPQGWEAYTDDESGSVYYYNEATGESTWERPQ